MTEWEVARGQESDLGVGFVLLNQEFKLPSCCECMPRKYPRYFVCGHLH